MKKTVFIFVIFIILTIVTYSLAEPFSLRSGIMFGDSPEEVRSKETSLTYSASSNDEHQYAMFRMRLFILWGQAPLVEVYKGAILGVDEGFTVFYYDEDSKLTDMLYQVEYREDTELYSKLVTSLTAKYGEPLKNAAGYTYPIIGRAYVVAGSSYTTKYDEWVYKTDDGYYVKIDLCESHENDVLQNDVLQFVTLSYHQFFDSDIQAIKDAETNSIESINSDI